MSIDVISLACPVCGAPFSTYDEKCGYCGSILVLRTDHPKINPATLNKQVIDKHIAEFRSDLRKDPDDSAAHYGLGVAYFNLRLTDDSVRELEEAARLMPENPNIQSQLAVVLKQAADEGRPNSRQKLDDRIEYTLRLDPDNFDALSLKADTDPSLSDAERIKILRQLYNLDQTRGLPRLWDTYTEIAASSDVRGTPREIELLRQAYDLDADRTRSLLADALRRRAISLSESDPYADVMDPTRSGQALAAWRELAAFLPDYATDELTKYLSSNPGLSKAGQRSLRKIAAEATGKETKQVQRQLAIDNVAEKAEKTTTNIVRPVVVGILKALGLFIALLIVFGVISSMLSEDNVISTILAFITLLSLPVGLILMPIKEVKKARLKDKQINQIPREPVVPSFKYQEPQPVGQFDRILAILRSHFLIRWERESSERLRMDNKNGGQKAEKLREKQFKASLN